ncbi:MAG TPA: hypothetical protein VF627_11015, partial [Abditibacterium sp.]
MWRERQSVYDHTELINQKISALYFAYVAVAMAGFYNFPLLERTSRVFGASPAALWSCVLATLPMTWAIYGYLHRVEHHQPLLMTVLLSLLLPLLNLGSFSLLNGALDFQPVRVHRVILVQKRISGSRKTRSPWISVSDWADARSRISFTNRDALYGQSEVGDTLELTVGQ